MNIEGLLVAELNQVLSDETFTEIPKTRPKRFYTVERVGGRQTDVRDRPLVAVQAWANSRWEASEMALLIAGRLKSLAVTHPNVARVDIESIYNNPDPASEHPRYQVNAQFITT